METVTFKDLVDGVADLARVSPDEGGGFGDLLTEDVLPLTRTVERLVREAWEFYPWGELVEIAMAAYRPLWDATLTYADDDEVYFNTVAGEEGYFVANQATTAAQSPVTHPAKWDALELERLVIDKEVWGIGRVIDIWAEDPREAESERAARLQFVIRSDGVQVGSSAGATVYVEHMPAPPVLRGSAFAATAVYAAGESVLFENEDFWVCLATTTAGQSPTTNPELWELQEIPGWFREFVIRRGNAWWLRRDGAPDLAQGADNDGWLALYQAIDRIEGQQGQVRRYRVGNTR